MLSGNHLLDNKFRTNQGVYNSVSPVHKRNEEEARVQHNRATVSRTLLHGYLASWHARALPAAAAALEGLLDQRALPSREPLRERDVEPDPEVAAAAGLARHGHD
jgi:hypothetical protein